MAVAVAIGAFVSGVFSVRSCFFFQVQLDNELTGEPIEETMRGYGYFSREVEIGEDPDYDSCIAYTPEELKDTFNDWWFKYGQFFATLALALGGLGMLIICTMCCLAFHLHMFEKLLLWIYLLAAICQGLAFFGFGTHFAKENICKVGPGTGMAISAFMMWLTVANTVKSTPEALPPEEYRGGDDNYDSDDDDDMYYYDDEDGDDDDNMGDDKKDDFRDEDDRQEFDVASESQQSESDAPSRQGGPNRTPSEQSVTKPEIV